MGVKRKLLVVLLIHTAIASNLLDGIQRCKTVDVPCLTNMVQTFLRALIRYSFDPYHVDHIDHTNNSGQKVALSDVNISGFRNVVLAIFMVNKITKDVALTLDGEPEIVTDIQSDGQSSKISMKGKIRTVAEYKYKNVPNAEGVNYLELGPNTLKCEPLGDPEVSAISGAGGEVWKATTPLPFPACRADHIDCLRRGIRTFFFLMDSGHLGMKPVDPVIVNSVAVTMPEEDMMILMRRVNVTGAKWTKLADRKFNLDGGKSGIRFISDLHLTGEITLTMASRLNPYVGYITMDMQDVESNITYPWSGERGLDNEDYIFIGPERIAVRNTRAPTFFIQPDTEEAHLVNKVLEMKPIIVEHLSNEVTTALMHSVIDNFRLFASKVPVKYYYKYF